jgi:hypothetical protein
LTIAPFVQQALTEFKAGKTLRAIQHETALVWSGRAIAAQLIGRSADAIEYAHEAVEHAALSGAPGLVEKIRAVLRDPSHQRGVSAASGVSDARGLTADTPWCYKRFPVWERLASTGNERKVCALGPAHLDGPR